MQTDLLIAYKNIALDLDASTARAELLDFPQGDLDTLSGAAVLQARILLATRYSHEAVQHEFARLRDHIAAGGTRALNNQITQAYFFALDYLTTAASAKDDAEAPRRPLTQIRATDDEAPGNLLDAYARVLRRRPDDAVRAEIVTLRALLVQTTVPMHATSLALAYGIALYQFADKLPLAGACTGDVPDILVSSSHPFVLSSRRVSTVLSPWSGTYFGGHFADAVAWGKKACGLAPEATRLGVFERLRQRNRSANASKSIGVN